MEVAISVGGKFHAFHLARQLEKRGHLERIFTSYPWFAVKNLKLPRHKISCLILKEILERGLSKTPYLSNRIRHSYWTANIFDRQVANRIKPCDIFVGWSGFSLHTLRRIRKKFPAKIILEHNCAHLETERDILIEERERLRAKVDLFCPEFIQKELEEYQEADYIAVPSRLSQQTFLAKGFPQERLICVSHGVATESFKPLPKNDRTFRIICVGISIRKGIHYILKAVNELRIKDLEVWLIGKICDDIKPFLKKYAGTFRYLGGIPQEELYKYYSQGSISALFSLIDGFGLALLEAMACGLPVICSDSVGAKDAVRENIDGFIVPARDIKTLKEKILYLYENPHICQEMGRMARENVTHNFTWDNYGEKITNSYLNLLNH